MALLLSVPIYPFFMNSMEASAKRKQEIGLATGAEPHLGAPMTREVRSSRGPAYFSVFCI